MISQPGCRFGSDKKGGRQSQPLSVLLLLLALRVSLVAVLMGGLRMLLCSGRVLLALGVVALAMAFRSGPVCLGSILVVLRSFVVFVSCHGRFPFALLPAGE